MKQTITLDKVDLEIAVQNHVESAGIVLENKEVTIHFTNGRGGASATIDVDSDPDYTEESVDEQDTPEVAEVDEEATLSTTAPVFNL